MSIRKQTLVAVGLLVVVAVAGVTAIAVCTPTAPEQYQRLCVGMTREQAWQALADIPAVVQMQGDSFYEGTYEWDQSVGVVCVDFQSSRVVRKEFTPTPLLQRLRARFRL